MLDQKKPHFGQKFGKTASLWRSCGKLREEGPLVDALRNLMKIFAYFRGISRISRQYSINNLFLILFIIILIYEIIVDFRF